MTVYSAGAINGVEVVASISGAELYTIREINKVFVEHIPLKTVVYYHGTGITNVSGRTVEISTGNGDTFNMLGWYVCNGRAGADGTPPDLIGAVDSAPKFTRGYSTYGSISGDDVKNIVNHTHEVNHDGSHTHTCDDPGDHRHTISKNIVRAAQNHGNKSGTWCTHSDSFIFAAESHTHSSQSSDGAHSNHPIGSSGVGSPNNRPYYKTLIPLIRLRIDNFEFPIGTIMWYDANDTPTVPWYKCDGGNGTLNLLNCFIRCESASNNSGGSNNYDNESHNHTDNSAGNHTHILDAGGTKSHWHYHDQDIWYSDINNNNYNSNLGGSSWEIDSITTDNDSGHSHSLNIKTPSHDHGGNTENEGTIDGVGYNKPPYYSMLLIQKRAL